MSAGFTPGPWLATGTFVGTAEDDSQTIAYASAHRNRAAWPEGTEEANARLIAAAPELYEALTQAVALIPANQKTAIANFEAALAKARGEV